MTSVIIISLYLTLLLALGYFSSRAFRGTANDFFLASRGIGPFLLVMSLFGTTMTAFALVGSTGEAFKVGIGVYGKLASSSGIVHSACFFFVGVKLWSLGKRHGYMTQIQYFRDRFESDKIGLILFPVLVCLVIPYLLIGVLSSGTVITNLTSGAFPELFASTQGGVPAWLGSGVICLVVLIYVFFGGVRGTAWANAFQTLVFILLGFVAFALISIKMGGPVNATRMVQESNPTRLKRESTEQDARLFQARVQEWEEAQTASTISAERRKPEAPSEIPPLVFFSYLFIPLSVGMFPHVFQHWLTAKSASSFKPVVIAHPLLILAVWLPCILLGTWATSAMVDGRPVIPDGFSDANSILAVLVKELTNPILGGLLSAGILAAIMSSLDSQFLCVGSMFTNDIVVHYAGKDRFTDRTLVFMARGFVITIVAVTYGLSLFEPGEVFAMGVWCFSGFSGLFPLVIAALYWKKTTRVAAYACVFVTGLVWAWFFYDSGFGKERGYLIFGMLPAATLVAISSLTLVCVSLVTRPVSEKTLKKFFA